MSAGPLKPSRETFFIDVATLMEPSTSERLTLESVASTFTPFAALLTLISASDARMTAGPCSLDRVALLYDVLSSSESARSDTLIALWEFSISVLFSMSETVTSDEGLLITTDPATERTRTHPKRFS